MTMGESMRKAREKSGLTIKQLSEKSGHNISVISHIETEKVEPRIYTVVDLADTLGISVDEYIGHTSKEMFTKEFKTGNKTADYIIKRQNDEIHELTEECKSLKSVIEVQKAQLENLRKKAGGMCGTCVYSKTAKWGKKTTGAFVECTNAEHIKKYCGRSENSKIRQRTAPACKSYIKKVGEEE